MAHVDVIMRMTMKTQEQICYPRGRLSACGIKHLQFLEPNGKISTEENGRGTNSRSKNQFAYALRFYAKQGRRR